MKVRRKKRKKERKKERKREGLHERRDERKTEGTNTRRNPIKYRYNSTCVLVTTNSSRAVLPVDMHVHVGK